MPALDMESTAPAASAEALLARAQALVPMLHARQIAAEADRRVPRDSIAALVDAGLFRVLQPRRYHGFECDWASFFDIGAEIGRGCGATGWVYSVMSSLHWVVALFPAAAQDDVWGSNPNALVAGSARPSGIAVAADGGWRVSGAWSFVSGCDHADWLKLGVAVRPDASAPPTHQALVLVPRADAAIDDQWDVVGLAGTGSKNVIVADAFVPAHRMLGLTQAASGDAPGLALNPAPLYRVPLFAGLSIALCAPAVGMAAGMLDDFLAATSGRATVGGIESQPKRMAELPAIQLRAAEAACAIDAARLVVLRDCRDIMASVATGGCELSAQTRARNKADLAYATRLVLDAAEALFRASGGNGLFRSNRLQRAWRDLTAAAMHVSLNWDASGTNFGRLLLGLGPAGSQF